MDVPLETTLAERIIHLVLFLTGGLTLGLAALAGIERLAGDGTRIVRWWYAVAAAAAFALVFGIERLYHAL